MRQQSYNYKSLEIQLCFMQRHIYIQLLGHLLQVVKRVADDEKLEEGYRVGKRLKVLHYDYYYANLQLSTTANMAASQCIIFTFTSWEVDSSRGHQDEP